MVTGVKNCNKYKTTTCGHDENCLQGGKPNSKPGTLLACDEALITV